METMPGEQECCLLENGAAAASLVFVRSEKRCLQKAWMGSSASRELRFTVQRQVGVGRFTAHALGPNIKKLEQQNFIARPLKRS